MTTYTIVELLGDGISSELSQSVHTVAEAKPFTLEFRTVDLSDEARKRDAARVFDDAEGAIADGARTGDIGGDLSTTEFTAEVARRLAAALR